MEKSYRGTDALNESSFERRPVQFLYRDADALHFMDSSTFNQFSFPLEELRDQSPFMTENMEGVESLVVDDEVIGIELPDTVELPIVEPPRRARQLGHRAHQASNAFNRLRRSDSRAPRSGRDRPRRHPHRRIPGSGELIEPTGTNCQSPRLES